MGESTTEISMISSSQIISDRLPPVINIQEPNATVRLELENKSTPTDEILNEYYDKLQNVKYHQDLVALPLDGSTIPKFGKNYFSSNFQRVVWDSRFDPDKVSDEDVINISSKIHTLAEMYKNTCHKLGLTNDEYYAYEPSVEGLKNIMENKKKLINLLKPGNYVAHGGYVDDLEKILELKGLSSSVGQVNAGKIKETEIPRWGKFGPNHPDKSAVFFYHWTNPKAGSYFAPLGEVKGASDLCIIYPTEDLIDNAGAILINFFRDDRNLEIGVTNSPTSIRAGELVDSHDDSTLLPLDKAFLIIPVDREKEVQNMLLSNGYSDEWIKVHVKSLQIEGLAGPFNEKYNNMGEIIETQKENINDWLQQNHKPTDRKISISSRTGSMEGLFKAKLE